MIETHFEVMCDASDFEIRAMLRQRKGKVIHPIDYINKMLKKVRAHIISCWIGMATLEGVNRVLIIKVFKHD